MVELLFEYQLKRSARRKTVAIKVHQRSITVYAPHYVPKKQLDLWLVEKRDWVNSQLDKQINIADSKQYPLETHKILIFSNLIDITFEHALHSQVIEHENTLSVLCSSRVSHKKLKYKTLLEAYLTEKLGLYIDMRLAHFCKLMEEPLPNDLRIRIYKRKWGSCNSKRELTFNLLLIGAKKSIIDYVIVHELAHLRHLDHSRVFWQRVAKFYPDHKIASDWLKNNGQSLQWEF
ncbi:MULTISPECIES: M48 family metallopeptidase [Pseudoalteromonas]|uniref:M48 family metallopeptidase n=1 Tax=Pseudoalteromonas TaxID=53246 RepID=UPI0002AA6941|nr:MULTISPECIES: YgjP-like metallopeptidase domain-containing protein [unclassified Pseudoalteromonas]ALQ08594.1 hypothetical protein D172_011245 [Pseudoalteromonas sp. Bsw20308]